MSELTPCEIAARLDGLRELIDERDKRYGERFEHQRELNHQAFAASEKAIEKAEAAQKQHNEQSNEFRGQLKDQNQMQMPRAQAEADNKALRELIERDRQDMRKEIDRLGNEISALREFRSNLAGVRAQQGEASQKFQWAIGVAIGIVTFIVGLFASKVI